MAGAAAWTDGDALTVVVDVVGRSTFCIAVVVGVDFDPAEAAAAKGVLAVDMAAAFSLAIASG